MKLKHCYQCGFPSCLQIGRWKTYYHCREKEVNDIRRKDLNHCMIAGNIFVSNFQFSLPMKSTFLQRITSINFTQCYFYRYRFFQVAKYNKTIAAAYK